MSAEIILKTIAILVIIQSVLLLLLPAQMIALTRRIIHTKLSLRNTAIIMLLMGILIYIIAPRFI